jgi:hypothetical protein
LQGIDDRRLFFNLGDRNQMLEKRGKGYVEFIWFMFLTKTP